MKLTRSKPKAKRSEAPGTGSPTASLSTAGLPRFLRGLQAKSVTGAPGDVWEREADRIAAAATGSRSSLLPDAGSRRSLPLEQPKPFGTGGPRLPIPAADSGSALNPGVRATIESQIGADLSPVRVHSGPSDRALAERMNAKAFTHGNEIWLGPNQSGNDLSLMAHEATHVVQQARGRSSPLVQRQPAAPAAAPEEPLNYTPSLPPGPNQSRMPDPVSRPDAAVPAGPAAGASAEERELVRQLNIRKEVKAKLAERDRIEAGANNPAIGPPEDQTAALERVNGEIDSLVELAGLDSVEDFEALPARLIEVYQRRAVEVTRNMLEQNRLVAEREKGRYKAGDAGDTQSDMSRLRKEAGELGAIQTHILEWSQEWYANAPPFSPAPPTDAESIDSWIDLRGGDDPKIASLRNRYQTIRQIYGTEFPILLAEHLDFRRIASAPPAVVEKLVNNRSSQVLSDIQSTQESLTEEKVWSLPPILSLTKQVMGIAPGSGADEVISQHQSAMASDALWKNIALAALGIGLGLVAIFATGGLALAALVGSAGLGVYNAATHFGEFQFQSAAYGSTLDPAAAISKDKPGMFWLAVDLVAAAVDVGAAAMAFRNLARVGTALADLEEAARAQARVLAAEGKLRPGMTEDIFVSRIMESARGTAKVGGEAALKRIAIIAEITEGTSPRVARLMAGDSAALEGLLREHGNWKQLTEVLARAGTPETEQIGRNLLNYRNNLVESLAGPPYFARVAGKPSTEMISDVDLSTEGVDAGEKLIAAENYMKGRFGPNWSEMLRMNFYTDASRLTLYETVMRSLGAGARGRLLRRMSAVSDKYNFARMLHHAGEDPAALARVRSLAEAAGVNIEDSEIKALAALGDSARSVRRDTLLKEIDAMMAEYSTASGARRTELAEQISLKQMEANFYTTEAYIGPGAGRMTVGRVAVIGQEAYQSATSDLEMIEHIMSQSGQDAVAAAREYELYKYVNRFVASARNAGVSHPGMDYFEHLSEYLYRINRGAQGETAHLWADPKILSGSGSVRVTDLPQDLGGLPPATSQFVRAYVNQFFQFAREVLPKMKQSAQAAPGAWAPR